MGKRIKIFLFVVGGLLALSMAAVFILPKLIDVQKYKPLIVEKLAVATGRPVSLTGDLQLSLFPWVGVSFSDFSLGNPEGFEGKDFVVVKSFEAHVKVMPLLSKEVQIDSFVLDGLELNLEKRKDGRGNWEGLGGSATKEPAPKEAAPATEPGGGLKSIAVAQFSILNARIRYVDPQQGVKKEISDLTLQLTDVSLERPIALHFSAVMDGKGVAVDGHFGPLGPKPGEGTLPLDLTVKAGEQFAAQFKGQLDNPTGDLSYRLDLNVPQFSPRKLMSDLKMEFPIATSDPAALETVAVSMNIAGNTKSAVISDGRLVLDASKIQFVSNTKVFTPLNMVFDGNLDAIDLDRYLPAKKEQAQGQAPAAGTSGKGGSQKTDYAPLRKLILDAKCTVGELKVQGGIMQNVVMHFVAKNGILKLSPVSMDLYGGKVSSAATVNVQSTEPATSVTVKITNVQVGPLLRDFAQKDVLEGNLVSEVNLSMKGDTPESIKPTLNGKGELLFTDGAIVGIDLAGMVRNVQASFGLADRPTEKPRTDFAELRVPFTLKNGLFNTPATALQSPLMRVSVSGDANLVNEALDMKVEPKFVATLKGQGDTSERKGVMVPVMVRGTFSSPVFSPDLTALLQGQLPDVESVKNALEQELNPEKILPKDQGGTVEKGLKNLIPKLQLK